MLYVYKFIALYIILLYITFVHLDCFLFISLVFSGLVKDAFFISVILSTLPVIFACTFVCMPESPIYLMSKQRKEEAQNSLQWLRGRNCNIDAELTEMRISANRTAAERRASFFDLFRNRVTLKALCITLGLMVFQQLSGINAIIFYSQNIFQSVGSAMDPTVATIIVGAVQVSYILYATQ